MYIKNTLYVGVDVSFKSLTTCILDTISSIIFKPANFSNDPSGVDTLFAKILELAKKHDVEDIFISLLTILRKFLVTYLKMINLLALLLLKILKVVIFLMNVT